MKILVIKIAAIGDFLMATPAIAALKRNHHEILILAGQSIKPVVENNPFIDRIFFVDDWTIYHGSFWGKVQEVLRLVRLLRREKIEAGFNFQRDWRFNIILLLSGISKRIGFARNGRGRFLTRAVQISEIKHHIFHYCDLVKVLGIRCLDFKMVFPLTEEMVAQTVTLFLKPEKLGRYIALAPGGAANVKEKMASRHWPKENYSRLTQLLVAGEKKWFWSAVLMIRPLVIL